MLIDKCADCHAQRKFNEPRGVNMAADAIEFGSIASRITGIFGIGRDPYGLKPIDTFSKNMDHICQGFRIIDNGGFAENPFNRWKRGFDAGPSPFALEAFDKSGFFAANIGTRPAMDENIQRVFRSQNILTQKARGIGLVDSLLHDAHSGTILIADIKIGGGGLKRVRRKENPLEDLMGILFHQHPVVKGTWFGLIDIYTKVNWPGVSLGKKCPL